MLKNLMKAESAAWGALMNDPKVLADSNATHTPELLQAWRAAADAVHAYRVKMGLSPAGR